MNQTQLSSECIWIGAKIELIDENNYWQYNLVITSVELEKNGINEISDRILEEFNNGVPFLPSQNLLSLPIGNSFKAIRSDENLLVKIEILPDISLNETSYRTSNDFYRAFNKKIIRNSYIGFCKGIPRVIVPCSFY